MNEMNGVLMGGKRILLVDHEPQIRDTVAEALAALEVAAVGNVEEDRPLITKESFDLVILDTVGADGRNLLKDCHANKLHAALPLNGRQNTILSAPRLSGPYRSGHK
jgi:DNA-binding response OmpR family regulator